MCTNFFSTQTPLLCMISTNYPLPNKIFKCPQHVSSKSIYPLPCRKLVWPCPKQDSHNFSLLDLGHSVALQPYLLGMAKWKKLPNLYLFFPILIFSRFSPCPAWPPLATPLVSALLHSMDFSWFLTTPTSLAVVLSIILFGLESFVVFS